MALLSVGASLAPLGVVLGRPVAHVDRVPLSANDAAMHASLLEARRWIVSMYGEGHTIVPFPVSRLQRQFALGYSYTCTLAELLVESGQWTIAFTADGSRYAQLHPTAMPG